MYLSELNSLAAEWAGESTTSSRWSWQILKVFSDAWRAKCSLTCAALLRVCDHLQADLANKEVVERLHRW